MLKNAISLTSAKGNLKGSKGEILSRKWLFFEIRKKNCMIYGNWACQKNVKKRKKWKNVKKTKKNAKKTSKNPPKTIETDFTVFAAFRTPSRS